MSNGTVLYVGGFCLPDKNAAANRVTANGKILEAIGYKTVYLGLASQGESFEGLRAVEGDERMLESAAPVGSADWIRQVCSTEHIRMTAERCGDVAAVILYNRPCAAIAACRRALKPMGIKVICDFTEWTDHTEGTALKRLVKKADEKLVRFTPPLLADGIIAVSGMMERRYSGKKPCVLIPPLMDCDSEPWAGNRGEPFGKFTFCFAGVPDGQKDSLDAVVTAFSSIGEDNASLVIVGLDKPTFAALYPQSAEAAEDPDIHFEGRLPHSDTVRLLKRCDCAFFLKVSDTRNNAGFPTRFAEAYTSGLPIVTTAVSDVEKYARPGFDEILTGTGIEEIKAAMLRVLSRGRIASPLDRTFHFASYTEKMREFFNDVINGR